MKIRIIFSDDTTDFFYWLRRVVLPATVGVVVIWGVVVFFLGVLPELIK